jgi:hypothetical protein
MPGSNYTDFTCQLLIDRTLASKAGPRAKRAVKIGRAGLMAKRNKSIKKQPIRSNIGLAASIPELLTALLFGLFTMTEELLLLGAETGI